MSNVKLYTDLFFYLVSKNKIKSGKKAKKNPTVIRKNKGSVYLSAQKNTGNVRIEGTILTHHNQYFAF